ncbi:hypothetical protein P7C73_g1333, partial [Tremellales sp. Uapishka_1]
MQKAHLVVLIHGLYGTTRNLAALKDELLRESAESTSTLPTEIYLSRGFEGSHTWDGIDINAWRVAKEIDLEVERLYEEGKDVAAFSVMGYSLGGHKDESGRCLLEILADPGYVFVQALNLFPKILIVANGCQDNTVPYPTAAISLDDPFAEFEASGLTVESDEDHIVQSWKLPGEVKPHLLSEATGERVVKKRPRIPPIFFLPYPFTYVLSVGSSENPDNVSRSAAVFALHTYQSSKRIRSHHVAIESAAVPLLSADSPFTHGSSTPRILDPISSSSSLPTTPPFASPSTSMLKIPLLLTPKQKLMVHNLNASLPQMARMISWFPWAFNSHAVIIVRDPGRIKDAEDGRGVVRAWARYVVASLTDSP